MSVADYAAEIAMTRNR